MNSKLNVLLNAVVLDTQVQVGCLHLFFSDRSVLNIYNDFSLLNGHSLEQIKGQRILNIVEDKSEIVIYFSNDFSLRIDLNDNAYHGPEALQFDMANGDTIIWN